MRFAAIGLILLASAVAPLEGPNEPVLEGVVIERGGSPIAAARVALRGQEKVLVSVTTGPDGQFRFSGPQVEQATAVEVERLGFVPAERPLSSGETWMEIALTPDPLQLQGLTVAAEREICEQPETEEARALWEALASNHRPVPDTLGMATYVLFSTAALPEDELGSAATGELEEGQRGSAPLLRFGWIRRIQRDGYAFPVRRASRNRTYDSWSYPPLEAELAHHFASSLFGDLHRFHFPSDLDGEIVVFCPEDRTGPRIRGQIRIAPDSTVSEVEWLFDTSEPSEQSGGRVYFARPELGNEESSFLVPSEGITWRKQPDGTFVQRYQRFEGWVFAPGDSVPFLPQRAP